LNVGEQFSDEGFYENNEKNYEDCGKKDATTSLNVGEQFLDEGFYENNCFFFSDSMDGKKEFNYVIECRRAIFRRRIL